MSAKPVLRLRYPIHSKLLLYTFVLIGLTLLVIYQNYQSQLSAYSSQINQQIEQRNQLLALMQTQLLESKLEAIDQTLKLISSYPDFIKNSAPHTYLLEKYSQNNPEMQALLHINADGLLRYPMHQRSQLDLSGRDYLKCIRTQKRMAFSLQNPCFLAGGIQIRLW